MRDPQWSDKGVSSHHRPMNKALAVAALLLAVAAAPVIGTLQEETVHAHNSLITDDAGCWNKEIKALCH